MIITIQPAENGQKKIEIKIEHIRQESVIYGKYQINGNATFLHNYNKGDIDLAITALKIIKNMSPEAIREYEDNYLNNLGLELADENRFLTRLLNEPAELKRAQEVVDQTAKRLSEEQRYQVERIPWFQAQSADMKEGIFFGLSSIISVGSYLILNYVSPEIIASIAPYFLIIAGIFSTVVVSKMFHKVDKR